MYVSSQYIEYAEVSPIPFHYRYNAYVPSYYTM